MIEEKKTEEKEEIKKQMWRPFWSSYFSVDELYQEAQSYFKHCEENIIENSYWKKIPTPKTISWLLKWLWVSKNYLSEKAKDESYLGMIQYIRNEIENDIEINAMLWFYNPTIASKNLSANFDWKDKTEVKTDWEWEQAKKEMYNTLKWKIDWMWKEEINNVLQDLLK